MVRIEKLNVHGKTTYSIEKWKRESTGLRIAKMKEKAIHELISSSTIRLFFDIDSDSFLNLFEQLPQLDAIVYQ